MDKLNMKTQDLFEKNVEKLSELFPEVLTEIEKNGKLIKTINTQKLKELVGDIAVEKKEFYELSWAGKSKAKINLAKSITNTLKLEKEEGINTENTKNIFIEGENLKVLKILQNSYQNKIKMIYIDPPYNTGKDFIYNDNFRENKKDFEEQYTNEEGEKYFKNIKTNGRFHSDWLNMMYERLVLARNLLKDDGVIFISIDDNEVSNLKLLCDEIFGEENFLRQISIKKKQSAGVGQDAFILDVVEYILLYSKNKLELNKNKNKHYKEYEIDNKILNDYSSIIENYGEKKLFKEFKDGRDNLVKIFEYENVRIRKLIKEEKNKKFFLENYEKIFTTYNPQSSLVKKAISETKDKRFYSIEYKPLRGQNEGILTSVKIFNNRIVQKLDYITYINKENRIIKKERLTNFWEDISYDTLGLEGFVDFKNGKKPLKLLKRNLLISTNPNENDIILDFFAGSGTTGHAVLEQNLEDCGNRKFILCQLDEEIKNDKDNKESYDFCIENNFKPVISSITKERLRRVIKKINEEKKENYDKIDLGFKSFKLNESCMRDVYYKPDEISQKNLIDLENNIKENVLDLDVLYQAMLEMGIELDCDVREDEINGKKVFRAENNSLIALFDNNVDLESVRKVVEEKPLRILFLDKSFKDNTQKINILEYLKNYGEDIQFKII